MRVGVVVVVDVDVRVVVVGVGVVVDMVVVVVVRVDMVDEDVVVMVVGDVVGEEGGEVGGVEDGVVVMVATSPQAYATCYPQKKKQFALYTSREYNQTQRTRRSNKCANLTGPSSASSCRDCQTE